MEVIRNTEFLKLFLEEGIYKVSPSLQRYPLVILFENAQSARLPTEQEELLEKILKAVQLNLDDVKLINLLQTNPEDNWQDWQEIPASYLIAFGVQIPVFSVKITPYELKHYHTLSFFVADTLSEIATDQEKKRQLWKILQEMFLNH